MILSAWTSIAVYGQRLTKSVTKAGVPKGEVSQRERDGFVKRTLRLVGGC